VHYKNSNMSGKKQVGALYSTMFIILVLIFLAVTAMKLWAPYFDDLAVKTALQNISEEETSTTMSPKDIRSTLNKRLEINGVNLKKEDVIIKKEDGVVNIDVAYERRVPLYGNIDAVLKFQHSATVNPKR